MDINVNNIFSNFNLKYQAAKAKTTGSSIAVADNNIFALASAMVSDYKTNSSNVSSNTTKNTLTSSMSYTQVANMSTKEFLNYAYQNQAKSGFSNTQNDSSEIKLPMLVRYKTAVISTSGKSFMQVVAKLKAKFKNRSEEEIVAELISKYADGVQIEAANKKYNVGSGIDLSA